MEVSKKEKIRTAKDPAAEGPAAEGNRIISEKKKNENDVRKVSSKKTLDRKEGGRRSYENLGKVTSQRRRAGKAEGGTGCVHEGGCHSLPKLRDKSLQ